jgi:hypothetical protein
MNILYKILIPLMFLSCVSTNYRSSDHQVEVIKFMGTYQTYSVEVNYDIFWEFPEEHARLNIINDFSLSEKFNKLPLKKEDESFEFLTYAFIYKNGKRTDTIYADQTLKAFKKYKFGKNKNDIEEIFYYDNSGETAKMLRSKFSFFKECW